VGQFVIIECKFPTTMQLSLYFYVTKKPPANIEIKITPHEAVLPDALADIGFGAGVAFVAAAGVGPAAGATGVDGPAGVADIAFGAGVAFVAE